MLLENFDQLAASIGLRVGVYVILLADCLQDRMLVEFIDSPHGPLEAILLRLYGFVDVLVVLWFPSLIRYPCHSFEQVEVLAQIKSSLCAQYLSSVQCKLNHQLESLLLQLLALLKMVENAHYDVVEIFKTLVLECKGMDKRNCLWLVKCGSEVVFNQEHPSDKLCSNLEHIALGFLTLKNLLK